MKKSIDSSTPPVKLFTLMTCNPCKEAKRLLKEHKIPHKIVHFDLLTGDERSTALKELKAVNPECTFPTIVIGDKVIVGFKENEIKKALSLQ